MRKVKQLYMYALMPDEELRVKLEAERIRFSEQYNTKKALRIPIHITLIPPFEYYGDPGDLVKAVEPVAERHKPFEFQLDGYGSFQRNPVFFINVRLTKELEAFQADLRKQFHKSFTTVLLRQSTDFKPHITLGYRDLTVNDLTQAIADYKYNNVTANWPVANFVLWKHVAARWETIHEFKLA